MSRPIQAELLKVTAALVGVAVACEIGLWWSRAASQYFAPMWPAAGVSFAVFCLIGRQGWLPVIVGHCWFLFRVDSLAHPLFWFLPVLYAGEAWFATRMRQARPLWVWGIGETNLLNTWDSMVAPALSALTATAIAAYLVALRPLYPGTFGVEAFLSNWLLIFSSHLHGMIALGPLLYYIFKTRCMRDLFVWRRGATLATAVALLAVVLINILCSRIDGLKFICILIPIPFLLIAASLSSESQSSVIVAVWCILTTFMSFVPTSLLALRPAPVWTNAELALANIVIAGLIHGVSLAGSNYSKQLESGKLAMRLGRVHRWEWTFERGFLQFPSLGLQGSSHADRRVDPDIFWLAGGTESGNLLSNKKTWRTRIRSNDPLGGGKQRHLDSTGRVLSRNQSGEPTHVIGLIRDVTSEELARKKLLASDYQNALLKTLQANLNRHFLFNSLNMVKALVHLDSEKADTAISSLADLMRTNLRHTEHSAIPLSEELRQIEALLNLGKIRFGDKLKSQIDIPPSLHGIYVPPMLLLNLIENALTHGIEGSEEGGLISLSARAIGERVEFLICNSGTISPYFTDGMGVRDATERLNNLYDGESSFRLYQSAPNIVSATVIVPLYHELPHH